MSHKYFKGFFLIESLIAIAILILVVPSLLNYILSTDIKKYTNSLISHISKSIYLSDKSYLDNLANMNYMDIAKELVADKNCDLFFSKIQNLKTDTNLKIDTVSIDRVEDDNIFTSIDYIQGNSDHGILMIGLNSASTSMADLVTLDIDLHTYHARVDRSWYLGPGVIAMDMYPRSFENNLVSQRRVALIERSVVSPFWLFDLANINTNSSSSPIAIFSDIFLNAYPQAVNIDMKYITIGTQKSPGPELLIFDYKNINSWPMSFETGVTVNDSVVIGNYLYYASSKNPELDAVVIDSISTSTNTNIAPYRFDAPGELGNGKAIARYPYGLFLGRTVGNIELYALGDSQQVTSSHAVVSSYDTNVSVKKIISAEEGRGIVALFNSPYSGFRVLKHDLTKSIEELVKIDLPAYPNDLVCILDQVFITLQSTSTPLVVIHL